VISHGQTLLVVYATASGEPDFSVLDEVATAFGTLWQEKAELP
jgi:hypothetical protein